MFHDGRRVRSSAALGCSDLFGQRSNFDLPRRFELFGGIPCFLRSQGEGVVEMPAPDLAQGN